MTASILVEKRLRPRARRQEQARQWFPSKRHPEWMTPLRPPPMPSGNLPAKEIA
jgi:hypothetical protein